MREVVCILLMALLTGEAADRYDVVVQVVETTIADFKKLDV